MKALAFISAAVRKAIGQPVLPILARRAHQAIAATEAQKQREAESKLPQPMRLWLLARRKRECRKRRRGDSAKSPAANRKQGTPRLSRVDGIGSYDYFKRQQAADRAARSTQP